jgi:hypothetical protein
MLLPAQRTAQTQNKRTQTSITQVGFEPTISVFVWAKTVHALDSAASVMFGGDTTENVLAYGGHINWNSLSLILLYINL